jgi:hypothetical protein
MSAGRSLAADAMRRPAPRAVSGGFAGEPAPDQDLAHPEALAAEGLLDEQPVRDDDAVVPKAGGQLGAERRLIDHDVSVLEALS